MITVGGCSGGPIVGSPRSGVATGSGAPVTTTTPAAKTADPPTAFDADAGVPLPVKGFSTNIGGDVTAKFMTLRDRTAYIVEPTGLTAVDVLAGKRLWTTPVEGAPGDPTNQSGPFVNTTGPRPPVVTDNLAVAAVPVEIPEQGTAPSYFTLTVLAVNATTGKKAWQSDTKVADDQYADASNSITKVVAVTDKAIIATYDQDGGYAGASGEHLTVALDPATGKTLWTRQEYSGGSVHGDTLVGVDYTTVSSYRLQAIALDAKTGKDLSTEVGVEPYWVSRYAAIGVSDDGAPMTYPVKK